jgi:hypothetical protein
MLLIIEQRHYMQMQDTNIFKQRNLRLYVTNYRTKTLHVNARH